MAKRKAKRTRLTVGVVTSLEPGKTVYDERVPNLAVRVSPKGRRTFFVLGKGGERATIGPYPTITLDLARKRAREINELFVAGTSPRKQRLKERMLGEQELTWQTVWEDYRENRERKRANSHSRTLDHQWKKHLSRWADRDLSEITIQEVRPFILKLREPTLVTANRVHRQGKAMFNHAISELKWEGDNPFDFRQQSEKGRERDRSVSKDELQRLFAAFNELPNQNMADLFRMCIYTGQRVGNVREMRLSDIDLDEGVWRIPHTKQGKPHTVVLSTAALELLKAQGEKSDLVFPGRIKDTPITSGGYRKAWRHVLAIAKIESLTVHDLRSVHATKILEVGVIEEIQQQLGHASSVRLQANGTTERLI